MAKISVLTILLLAPHILAVRQTSVKQDSEQQISIGESTKQEIPENVKASPIEEELMELLMGHQGNSLIRPGDKIKTPVGEDGGGKSAYFKNPGTKAPVWTVFELLGVGDNYAPVFAKDQAREEEVEDPEDSASDELSTSVDLVGEADEAASVEAVPEMIEEASATKPLSRKARHAVVHVKDCPSCYEEAGVASNGLEASAQGAASVHVNPQVAYRKRVVFEKNPQFYADIFNIPIQAIQAVQNLVSNTASQTSVSVQKAAFAQAGSVPTYTKVKSHGAAVDVAGSYSNAAPGEYTKVKNHGVAVDVAPGEYTQVKAPAGVGVDVVPGKHTKVIAPFVAVDVAAGKHTKVNAPFVDVDVAPGQYTKVKAPFVGVDVAPGDYTKVKAPAVGVAVDKRFGVEEAPVEYTKVKSHGAVAAGAASVQVKTPPAKSFFDDIFAIPINTLGAVSTFLQNNVPARKSVQVEGSAAASVEGRLSRRALRKAAKRRPIFIQEVPVSE